MFKQQKQKYFQIYKMETWRFFKFCDEHSFISLSVCQQPPTHPSIVTEHGRWKSPPGPCYRSHAWRFISRPLYWARGRGSWSVAALGAPVRVSGWAGHGNRQLSERRLFLLSVGLTSSGEAWIEQTAWSLPRKRDASCLAASDQESTLPALGLQRSDFPGSRVPGPWGGYCTFSSWVPSCPLRLQSTGAEPTP